MCYYFENFNLFSAGKFNNYLSKHLSKEQQTENATLMKLVGNHEKPANYQSEKKVGRSGRKAGKTPDNCYKTLFFTIIIKHGSL